jgi:hypothetical protein
VRPASPAPSSYIRRVAPRYGVRKPRKGLLSDTVPANLDEIEVEEKVRGKDAMATRYMQAIAAVTVTGLAVIVPVVLTSPSPSSAGQSSNAPPVTSVPAELPACPPPNPAANPAHPAPPTSWVPQCYVSPAVTPVYIGSHRLAGSGPVVEEPGDVSKYGVPVSPIVGFKVSQPSPIGGLADVLGPPLSKQQHH